MTDTVMEYGDIEPETPPVVAPPKNEFTVVQLVLFGENNTVIGSYMVKDSDAWSIVYSFRNGGKSNQGMIEILEFNNNAAGVYLFDPSVVTGLKVAKIIPKYYHNIDADKPNAGPFDAFRERKMLQAQAARDLQEAKRQRYITNVHVITDE